MNITDPRLFASQGANGLWTLKVTAFFEVTPEEFDAGFEFEREETVFELDALGADDLVIKSSATRFRPPSIRHLLQSEFRDIPRNLIDTELGDEEITVEISVREVSTGAVVMSRTPTVKISA
jgi:hypothetical protein